MSELEKCDKDKPVSVSVIYDNCEHIQYPDMVDDFESVNGDGWVTLIGRCK